MQRISPERADFERRLSLAANEENENSGAGVGLGWLLVLAIPCWVLIGWFLWELIA